MAGSLLDIDWIADREEYDEVVRWWGKSQQGYTFKHIAKEEGFEGAEAEIERRLERLYFAAVPLLLEAVEATYPKR